MTMDFLLIANPFRCCLFLIEFNDHFSDLPVGDKKTQTTIQKNEPNEKKKLEKIAFD